MAPKPQESWDYNLLLAGRVVFDSTTLFFILYDIFFICDKYVE
jgi:hypothetical protein